MAPIVRAFQSNSVPFVFGSLRTTLRLQHVSTAPPLRKPVLIIRLSTERPEAVEAGFAKVVGVDKKNIICAMEQALGEEFDFPWVSPYGDGNDGNRIANIVMKEINIRQKHEFTRSSQ